MLCQCVSGASAETIAQTLAFPFRSRRAAVCGNSFVHWVSALHWRVHVYMCCLGSRRGVNCLSEGWTVFVCLIRLSCLSWPLRGETWRVKNQTKLLHSLIHQLSGPVLCVQIPRRCILQRCFATFSVDLMQEQGVLSFSVCFVQSGIAIYTSNPCLPTTTTFSLHEWFSVWLGATKAIEWEYIFVYKWAATFWIKMLLLKQSWHATRAETDRMLSCTVEHTFVSDWLHVTGMASFVCVSLPSCFSSLQPSAPHRHTHELKQLPWHWPSVVIIYSRFTHSCRWHFSNTGIVHCVWESGRERDRKVQRQSRIDRNWVEEDRAKGRLSARKRENNAWLLMFVMQIQQLRRDSSLLRAD